MYKMSKWLSAAVAVAIGTASAADYPIRPIPFTKVQVQDTFWKGRMETVIRETIPHAFRQSEETGRIRNFMAAGGLISAPFEGDFGFNDSDVYKIIEGAAYSLSLRYDAELDAYLDRLISYIAAAQEDDGYLYTAWTLKARKSNPGIYCCYNEKRWDNLQSSHELYNVGHLYEAAVAHYQATGKRTLLDIALKNADLLCETFGFDKLQEYPGHQEVEIGLVKLYRVTGEEKYLRLAQFFLDVRGRGIRKYPEHGRNWMLATYYQDHKPVVEQEEAIGHAVRATYMYSGIADVAALTGNPDYLAAIDRIWKSVVYGKLYVTGGIGDIPEGEAFGPAYHLPNESAYCETCASIANVFWNHRMFLLHGSAEYIDILERTLYNALLSGLSLDGKTFFYPNVLETTGNSRSPWFGCACCPSNLCRFIPSLPGYVFAEKGRDIYVNLFISSRTTVNPAGSPVDLILQTDYPWDGKIRLMVAAKKSSRFSLHIRIPGWAVGEPVPSDLYRFVDSAAETPAFLLNGTPSAFKTEKGYAVITRMWKRSDRLELILPMPVRRVAAHPNVVDDRDKVALQRGPLVYCAEWPDNNGRALNLVLPDSSRLTAAFAPTLLGGVMVIRGTAAALQVSEDGLAVKTELQPLVAVPYYAWAHRGTGEMTVWLPRRIERLRILTSVDQ